MFRRLIQSGLCAIGLVLPAGCQSMPAGGGATVDMSDPQVRAAVTEVLARAVGRARIELGPVDGARTAVVTVLPRPPGPYETHSMAMPVRFDIRVQDGRCVAVRHDSGEAYDLPVPCRAGDAP